jgi:luciferase family oxidoreductase group 1
MLTARALRRDSSSHADRFPQDVQELLALFEPAAPGQAVRAVPGAGLRVPVWILGSSLFGASLAAALGLPFAFASHFAPEALEQAIAVYRSRFQPSPNLQAPYLMAGLNVFAAASSGEARRLFSSLQVQFTNLFRGAPGKLQPPCDIDSYWTPAERAGVERAMRYAVVGDRAAVGDGVAAFAALTGVDELMLTAQIHDHAARLRSFEIAAETCTALIGS